MDTAIEVARELGLAVVFVAYLVKDFLERRPIRVKPGEHVVVKDSRGHPYWFEGPSDGR